MSHIEDFSSACIFSPLNTDPLVTKAVSLLQGRILKRSGILVPIKAKIPEGNRIVLVVGVEQQLQRLHKIYRSTLEPLNSTATDGFKVASLPDRKTILIAGNDPRGVLYGVGYLLRKTEMRKNQIGIPCPLAISTSPRFPIRGQQITYFLDEKSTSEQGHLYEQYLEDLVCFGVNYTLVQSPQEVKVCREYGIGIVVYSPNVGSDFVTPEGIRRELQQRERIFRSMPHLDQVFVPGGDPGDLEPHVLFHWLEKVAPVLHKYHPKAKIWVSPQNTDWGKNINWGKATPEWYASFYSEVNRKYSWFGGVVFGPWVRTPIEQIRKIVRKDIPIQRFPDITHLISCQYPAPKLDLAFAETLGRMSIQPRPNGFKHIHNLFARYAIGSRPYSEGNSDDVNKFVWSGQDWNPDTPVVETLRDYVRMFIGPDYVEGMVQGLFGLEENLKGPLIGNDRVKETLRQWQDLEKTADPTVLQNPRFQMGLVRAYYDAYQQQRMVYETLLENQALGVLHAAKNSGTDAAIARATEIFGKAKKDPVGREYKTKVQELYESLYKCPAPRWMTERQKCEFVEHIDIPLNDSEWLISRLSEIRKAGTESDRLERIESLLRRSDPGPGGFYEDMGTEMSFQRVRSNTTAERDPGALIYPRRDYLIKGPVPMPKAWKLQMTTLYDVPLVIAYETLQPDARYRIRVNYAGIIAKGHAKMRLVANQQFVIHDLLDVERHPILEFPIPQEVVKTGRMELAWTCGRGEHGSSVAEVWIIKQEN